MDGSASSSSPSRSSNSRFKTLPVLHPHEVELRVNVKELSRPIAPEKFRSKTQSVGGFVFGLLVFPQGTKSAPEHARKNRGDDDDKNSKKGDEGTKKQRWISAFVEARPSEDYPANWYYQDVQFLVSLINHEEVARSIVKHDKHTFSPTESSDGKAIDRGWHDFVSCDEQTLRESGFVDADDHVCFRASVYLAGGPMKVTTSKPKRYLELQKLDLNGGNGPSFCNSIVQTLFHLGLFRNIIYGETIPPYQGTLSYGSTKGNIKEVVDGVQKGRNHEVLRNFRDVCHKLQLKNPQVVNCKEIPQLEGKSLDLWFQEFYKNLLSAMMPIEDEPSGGKKKNSVKNAMKQPQQQEGGSSSSKAVPNTRAEQLRDLIEFEIQWTGQLDDSNLNHSGKKGQSKNQTIEVTTRSPIFSFLIRGFQNLESCMTHYFLKKRVLDSGDGHCAAYRTIKSLPPITFWHLKRGEYDPEGLPETFFEFPRRLDMSRYVEKHDDTDLNYVLYAIIVEVEPSVGHDRRYVENSKEQSVNNDRRYYAFLRPEMEGDKGQWYRFDDGPVHCVHAVSNATTMDASLGGEEWLCVNYLYGPGSVLTRPKSSRATVLVYIRESEASQLLKEPRLPKKTMKEELLLAGKKVEVPKNLTPNTEDEIAQTYAESLIEELEQQELREAKKRLQKQKKKAKKDKRKEVSITKGSEKDSDDDTRSSIIHLKNNNNKSKKSLISDSDDDKRLLVGLKKKKNISDSDDDIKKITKHKKELLKMNDDSDNNKKLKKKEESDEESDDTDDNRTFNVPKNLKKKKHIHNDSFSDESDTDDDKKKRESGDEKKKLLKKTMKQKDEKKKETGAPMKQLSKDLSKKEKDRLEKERLERERMEADAKKKKEAATPSIGSTTDTYSCSGKDSGSSKRKDHPATPSTGSSPTKSSEKAITKKPEARKSDKSVIDLKAKSISDDGWAKCKKGNTHKNSTPSLPSTADIEKRESLTTSTVTSPSVNDNIGFTTFHRKGRKEEHSTEPKNTTPIVQSKTTVTTPMGPKIIPVAPPKPKASFTPSGRTEESKTIKTVILRKDITPTPPQAKGTVTGKAIPKCTAKTQANPSKSVPPAPTPPAARQQTKAASNKPPPLDPPPRAVQSTEPKPEEKKENVPKGWDTQKENNHPSSSSSAEPSKLIDPPGGWYPEQLIVEDTSTRVQFECAICHRIIRGPVVLPCAHLFCRCCLTDNQTLRFTNCPTCGQGGITESNLVCLEKKEGGALALLHRVYSGLKLRCVYHSELASHQWPEQRKTTLTCDWRGFVLDYSRHLDSCAAHCASLKVSDENQDPLVINKMVTGTEVEKEQMVGMNELGEMEVFMSWESDTSAPGIKLEVGDVLHISNLDESKQWVYAFQGSAHGHLIGWVPRNILQHKEYEVTYPFSSEDGGFIQLALGMTVMVYHREGNGWTYGARVDNNDAASGWFPDRCIE